MEELQKQLVLCQQQQQELYQQQQMNNLLMQQIAALREMPSPLTSICSVARQKVWKPLRKLSLEDNVDSFLTILECTAKQESLPTSQWARENMNANTKTFPLLMTWMVYELTNGEILTFRETSDCKIPKNVTHVTFANTVNIPGQNSNGVITAGNISMQFSCTYNITMETSLYTVFKPVMTSQNLNTGGVEGNAGTTLAAYVNPSYTQPLEQSQQDDLSIGSTLYFGMVTQFPDPAFVLRVDQCFATPTSDGSGAIKVQLIQGGCAVGGGPYTQVVENGISKEVRFSITAFAFQGYTTVYIFCDARLCYTPAGSCSNCSSSREASQESVRFGLGPFTYQDIIDKSASSQNDVSGSHNSERWKFTDLHIGTPK
ncbi:unnamed protein product [Ranitomeya imitator]|uniref:ZP domain-containing protein n=1 Tax=Ranitomeya imitator TaxID=111125 RepID=A0ABN9MQK6_9NEOB|nr:unnamed protein product [Ranitomeya imitator]